VSSAFLVMGFSFSGMGENAALAFPTLKDWSERGEGQSADDETAAVNARFAERRRNHGRHAAARRRAGQLGWFCPASAGSWRVGPRRLARGPRYAAGPGQQRISTGEAMAELERIASELPAGIGYEWTGLSYQEKVASGQAAQLFALAILVVFLFLFLLLVALYESWAIPLAVMLIVPVGALGGGACRDGGRHAE